MYRTNTWSSVLVPGDRAISMLVMSFADPTNQAMVSQGRTITISALLLLGTLGLAGGYVAVQGTATHQPDGWDLTIRAPRGFVFYQQTGDDHVQMLVFGGALASRRRADLVYWRSDAGVPEQDALSWMIWYLTDSLPKQHDDGSFSLEGVVSAPSSLAGRPAYEYTAQDGSAIARMMIEASGQTYGLVLLLSGGDALDGETRAVFEQACAGLTRSH